MRYFLIFVSFSLIVISCDQIDKIISNTANTVSDKSDSNPENISTGLREKFYPNGKIKSSINYKDGIKHGTAKNYYDNGNLKLSMTYDNGKKTGKSSYYYEDGQLYRESFYINDQLDGLRKVFKNGKLKSEIPYRKGHPGKGIKEYLLNGKLKTKYPKILVKPIDKRLIDGSYILDIYFSESHVKDKFYVGELEDGIYVHDGLETLIPNRGHGKLMIFVPPGGFIMKKLDIIGVHTTKQGNPYVTTRTYNLSVE